MVWDQRGDRGRRIFAEVSRPEADDGSLPGGAEHLRFTSRYQYFGEPRQLRVQWFAAKVDPLRVVAVRVRANQLNHEQQPLGPEEVVTLTERQPAAFVLGPKQAPRAERPAPAKSTGASPRSRSIVLVMLAAAGVMTSVLLWSQRSGNEPRPPAGSDEP
jgi:hypothetical protein